MNDTDQMIAINKTIHFCKCFITIRVMKQLKNCLKYYWSTSKEIQLNCLSTMEKKKKKSSQQSCPWWASHVFHICYDESSISYPWQPVFPTIKMTAPSTELQSPNISDQSVEISCRLLTDFSTMDRAISRAVTSPWQLSVNNVDKKNKQTEGTNHKNDRKF